MLDPVIKRWMFENWVADREDEAELAKNHAYLLGSFWNPEAVKKLTGDSANAHISSDEDMEKSLEMVRAANPTAVVEGKEKGKKKRRKRILKD